VRTNKRLPGWSIAAIGGVAALLGLLLGATVLGAVPAIAQETTTTTAPAQGEDQAERDARETARIRAALDALVADGTISADQADAVASHLAGHRNFHGRRLHRIHAGLDVAAATIGITESDLIDGIRDGQSVAEVAEANGVEAQTVIEAILAEINARVDETVASGDLDADRATEIKAQAVERVTDFVNGELGLPGRGHVAPAA
jgi:polyhydroxyalkanoate synthesis regulator phasin